MQELIGVRSGAYLGKNDIVSFEETYGRVRAENVMAIASAPAEDRTMLVSPIGEV